MLRELRHPNVLEFVGWNKVECLLVTELMRGGSLYMLINMSIHACERECTRANAAHSCVRAHIQISTLC